MMGTKQVAIDHHERVQKDGVKVPLIEDGAMAAGPPQSYQVEIRLFVSISQVRKFRVIELLFFWEFARGEIFPSNIERRWSNAPERRLAAILSSSNHLIIIGRTVRCMCGHHGREKQGSGIDRQ